MKKGLFEQKRERNEQDYLKCTTKEPKDPPIAYKEPKSDVLNGEAL
tara:strand:- start:112 stop:249 length:138 start_codon:yes stop_codon:yes gene_type:complete